MNESINELHTGLTFSFSFGFWINSFPRHKTWRIKIPGPVDSTSALVLVVLP